MTKNHTHGGVLVDCLSVICQFHDRPFCSESLISGLPLVDEQLTPSSFNRAAKRAGFKSQLVHSPLDALNQTLLPAVLMLENNSACVLTSINTKTNSATITCHPDEQPHKVTVQALQDQYAGAVIYLQPQFHFDGRAPLKQKSPQQGWFWPVVKQCRGLYRDVIIGAIFIGLLSLTMPLFVMNVYDRVVPNQAIHTLWVLAIGAGIALTADLVLRLTRSYFLELAASRIDAQVSSNIMERVLGMQLKNKPQASGSFAANLQSFESVRSFFSSMTLVSLVDLPFVLLYLAIIAIIGPALALPLIIGALVMLIYALASHNRLEQLSDDTMKVGAMRNAVLVESLNNIDDIKAFHGEGKIQSIWEKATLYLSQLNAQSRMLSASISNTAMWVQQGVGIAVILVGVHLVVEGDLTQGGLIAAYLLSSRAMAPVSQSAALLSQYHHSKTAMESLDEIMQKPIERPESKHWVATPHINGNIEFENVQFGYDPEEAPVLQNISIDIKAKEHIAIVGKNGSGKSTLEKLLLALYRVDSGHIKIDGVDINQLDPADLRHQIGYVPQDVSLMYGTLRENITLGAWYVEEGDILRIAKQTGLMALINAHPDGLDMQVGEQGKLLSGGQRQAVALARAMINNPSLLVLDEPTAALDHQSEKHFIQLIKEYAKDKTLILITHRASLLELVERIIVMDNGKVIADGDKKNISDELAKNAVKQAS